MCICSDMGKMESIITLYLSLIAFFANGNSWVGTRQHELLLRLSRICMYCNLYSVVQLQFYEMHTELELCETYNHSSLPSILYLSPNLINLHLIEKWFLKYLRWLACSERPQTTWWSLLSIATQLASSCGLTHGRCTPSSFIALWWQTYNIPFN